MSTRVGSERAYAPKRNAYLRGVEVLAGRPHRATGEVGDLEQLGADVAVSVGPVKAEIKRLPTAVGVGIFAGLLAVGALMAKAIFGGKRK